MIFSRTVRFALGRVVVAALLVAYAFNAAHACVASSATPATAFSKTGGCDGMNAPNTCLQQCTAGDQSAGHAELLTIAAPDVAVLTLSRQVLSITPLLVATAEPQRSPDPPPSIRFCSFQL